MSALLLMCSTALAYTYTDDLYPSTTTILTGETEYYTKSFTWGDDITGFYAAVTKSSGCSSFSTLELSFGNGAIATLPITSGFVSWNGDVDADSVSSISLSHSSNGATCRLTIIGPSITYTDDYADDAASIAVGILMTFIFGGICCCIIVIAGIFFICRRQGTHTTVVTQAAPYHGMNNDGYAAYPAYPVPAVPVGMPPPGYQPAQGVPPVGYPAAPPAVGDPVGVPAPPEKQ
eukprot:TRINITY_DN4602_c0_g4_i1.p1 TRINITY_DN4602_c0_g4~~TRINITY_DN4602_c0_g4_i1.p1  ORF type:complete len:258 (+),score=45.12 TRINITY_DN4602_c0_g4_i1:76-774(+)